MNNSSVLLEDEPVEIWQYTGNTVRGMIKGRGTIKGRHLTLYQIFKLLYLPRGGTTRWCRVQNLTCCSTGSRHQYIVI